MPPRGQKRNPGKGGSAAKSAPAAAIKKTSLFGPVKRNYGIGGAIQPRRDLSRMLKWPRYIRLQRQRKVLKMRLKVPPSIAQFGATADLNTGTATRSPCHRPRSFWSRLMPPPYPR